MARRVGIRLEDENPWERRAPLTPAAVRELVSSGVEIHVQRFPERVFADAEYAGAGAILRDDVRDCDLVLGIKQMPPDYFRPGGAYLFFSHTIKGQPENMAMLRRLVEKGCTLLDYERIVDDDGRRLIFFGRFAGIAGMVDTLWALGRRLEALGLESPFGRLSPAHRYPDLEAARAAVRDVGHRISREGVPPGLRPLAVGFTGYGHVSRGAQEIFDLLPHVDRTPAGLGSLLESDGDPGRRLVKVVYREEDLVEPAEPERPFDLQDYYEHGDRYRSRFAPHLERLTVLVNGIFWAPRYPRLADADQLRTLFAREKTPRLRVVGDITCDVDGSLACTVRDTDPGDPVYVYDPVTGGATMGFDGPGLAVMAVSNLPSELPRESSEAFSQALSPYVPALARAEWEGSLDASRLPDPMRASVILWRGQLAPDYAYMSRFLD